MKKSRPVKVLLAVAAIVLVMLCLTGCSDNSAALKSITAEKDELAKQVETLKTDAAKAAEDATKAAEDAANQITALTGEKDELAKQVETLTADAAKAAEEAQTKLDAMTAEAAKAASVIIVEEQYRSETDDIRRMLEVLRLGKTPVIGAIVL